MQFNPQRPQALEGTAAGHGSSHPQTPQIAEGSPNTAVIHSQGDP